MSETDIAWASGFYDGEGSVSSTSNNGKEFTRIQLNIGQKDFNGEIAGTLLKFKRIVGRGNIYRKTRIGKEINQHQFLVTKAKDVERVVSILWKYLSTTKKQQARKAFSLYNKGIKKLDRRWCHGEIQCPQ